MDARGPVVGDEGRLTIAVSLKMYFSDARTRQWCEAVAGIARAHPAVRGGAARLLVMPSFTSLTTALGALPPGTVGAQDLHQEDSGAFTGEVSGAQLAELGCACVVVGHAERRRLFGDTDEVVAAKVAAAVRNGLEPLLCVGEVERTGAREAAAQCLRQVRSGLHLLGAGPRRHRVLVAYEPVWAIGAQEPAGVDHVREVCRAVRAEVAADERVRVRVVYGGSARPGLLGALSPDVDGLFLGRHAHDPRALGLVLDEVAALGV